MEESSSGRDSQDDRLRIDQDASGQTIQLLQEAERVMKLGSLNGNTKHRKTGSWNFTFTKDGKSTGTQSWQKCRLRQRRDEFLLMMCVCVCELTEAPVDLDSCWDSPAGLSASSAGLILL